MAIVVLVGVAASGGLPPRVEAPWLAPQEYFRGLGYTRSAQRFMYAILSGSSVPVGSVGTRK